MNSQKHELIMQVLNKNIREEEQSLINAEDKIQDEKSRLGAIISHNRESAPLPVKLLGAAAGILFGMGLTRLFDGQEEVAAMAALISGAVFQLYRVLIKGDKHDRTCRKRYKRSMEELKLNAKKSKATLAILYDRADNFEEEIEQTGIIYRDEILEEEIRSDMKKSRYNSFKDKMVERSIKYKSKNGKELNKKEKNHFAILEIIRNGDSNKKTV
jgi:hypothetical protein